MYGLLLENLAEYIKINYGEDKWDEIRRQAGIDSPSFSVHQVYPENLLNKLAKKAQQVSALKSDQRPIKMLVHQLCNVFVSIDFETRCSMCRKRSSWIRWECASLAL